MSYWLFASYSSWMFASASVLFIYYRLITCKLFLKVRGDAYRLEIAELRKEFSSENFNTGFLLCTLIRHGCLRPLLCCSSGIGLSFVSFYWKLNGENWTLYECTIFHEGMNLEHKLLHSASILSKDFSMIMEKSLSVNSEPVFDSTVLMLLFLLSLTLVHQFLRSRWKVHIFRFVPA